MADHIYLARPDIHRLLLESGVDSLDVYPLASLYTPVSSAWVEGTLKTAYLEQLFAKGLTVAEPEDGDCDLFTKSLDAFVAESHRRTPDRPDPRAALAFGIVHLTLDGGFDHSMCVCVTGDAGVLEVRFVEPNPNAFGFRILQRTELQTIRLLVI